MADFKRRDLRFDYKWTASKENPSASTTEFSDDHPFDRREGYEVLAFINNYMLSNGYSQITTFNGIEIMIKEVLPIDAKEQAVVKKWFDENY